MNNINLLTVLLILTISIFQTIELKARDFDGRGPEDLGPATGRGLGLCSNPENARLNKARRFSWRKGCRIFMRAPLTKEEEKNLLQKEIQSVKEYLDVIQNRLDELIKEN